MDFRPLFARPLRTALAGVLVFAGLYATSRYSYVLFHSLAELFGIIIACSIFVLAWNSRAYLRSNYLLLLGIGYVFVSVLRVLHGLAYKGMGVFPGNDPDLPTQLWVSTRIFEAGVWLVAPLFIRRTLPVRAVVAVCASITTLIVASIFVWNIFPVAFIEGSGLTPFKIAAEYVIVVTFLAAAYLLYRQRDAFDPAIAGRLFASVLIAAAAELPFTLYTNVYDILNQVGHFLVLVSVYLVYQAVIVTGLEKPYSLLFRELKQAEERYRDLFDAAPGMYVVARDGTGQVTVEDCNELFLRTLGYTRDEALGQPLQRFYAPESRELSPDVHDGTSFGDVGSEQCLLTRDGRVVPVMFRAEPEAAAPGRHAGLRIMYADISERKAMEESLRRARAELELRVAERTSELSHANQVLRESEARFRAIFDRAGVGISLVDRNGYALQTNEAMQKMLGYSDDELRTMCFTEYTHPLDVPTDMVLFQELVSGSQVYYRLEKRYVRRDGQLIWAILSSTVVPGADGSPQFLVRMVEDISERKSAERELLQHSRRLQVLHDIDLSILAADTAGDIARVTVDQVRQVSGCQRSSVVLFHPAHGEARLLAVSSEGPTRFGAGTSFALDAYNSLVPTRDSSAGLADDLLVRPQLALLARAMMGEGLRSYAAFPLYANDKAIGVLDVWSEKPVPVGEEVTSFARQVADSLAVAIQDARLFEEVTAGHARLQELSRRLVAIQENERRAIARELHDEAGQALTSLMLRLGQLERECDCSSDILQHVGVLKQTTNAVLEGLHRLAVNLRPASLDRLGLVPALRQYVQGFEQQHGTTVGFVAVGLDQVRLPSQVEIALYRIVQEALTNVARHAGAQHVDVVVEMQRGNVIVVVEDNGIGFDPEDASQSGRLGLLGIRERAEMLGGALTVESAPGWGTTIHVAVPAKAEPKPELA